MRPASFGLSSVSHIYILVERQWLQIGFVIASSQTTQLEAVSPYVSSGMLALDASPPCGLSPEVQHKRSTQDKKQKQNVEPQSALVCHNGKKRDPTTIIYTVSQ